MRSPSTEPAKPCWVTPALPPSLASVSPSEHRTEPVQPGAPGGSAVAFSVCGQEEGTIGPAGRSVHAPCGPSQGIRRPGPGRPAG